MAAAVAAAAAAAAAVSPPVGGSLAALFLRLIAVVDPHLTATLSGHLVIAIVAVVVVVVVAVVVAAHSDVGLAVVIGGFGLDEDDLMMMRDGVTAVVALESGAFPHPEMRRIRFGDAAVFATVDVDVAGDERRGFEERLGFDGAFPPRVCHSSLPITSFCSLPTLHLSF